VTRRGTERSWRSRLGLVLLGFGLVAVVELAAAAVLWLLPPTTTPTDGFSSSVPPFVRERSGDGRETWVVHPARRHSFTAARFPVDLPERSALVFCLGGSSVYGYPDGAEFAFPDRLEQSLHSVHPDREVYVVNQGGMSYGSGRLRLLASQLMAYRPDVVVVYTGHNEFVEADAARLASAGGAIEAAIRPIRRLAIYRLGERLLDPGLPLSAATGRSEFGIDVQRREVRSVQAREVIEAAEDLATNLREIVRLARDGGATPVLCTVASNLADWRPENSAMPPDLPPTTVLDIASHIARARSLAADGQIEIAAEELKSALALDPGYAALTFDYARLEQQLGRTEAAHRLYTRARDYDPTPIRAPSALNEAIRDAAKSTGTVLVDVESAMASIAPDGIPGNELFLDYCHPSKVGHELIARLLLPEIEAALGLPATASPSPLEPPGLEPRAPDTADGFALWWQGNVALRQGRAANAEAVLRRAAELKPESSRPLVSLAQALRDQGRIDEAVEVSRRAVELEPDSVMALNSLGLTLGLSGQSDEALALLHRASELDPEEAAVQLNLGAEHLRRREADSALSRLDEAVRLHPNIKGAWRNIGLAHVLMGDADAAAAAFLEELRRNPLDLPAALRLAETAAQIGNLDIARRAADLAMLLTPAG
jgi:tetratricopeptide (TPR) repeat protein